MAFRGTTSLLGRPLRSASQFITSATKMIPGREKPTSSIEPTSKENDLELNLREEVQFPCPRLHKTFCEAKSLSALARTTSNFKFCKPCAAAGTCAIARGSDAKRPSAKEG